MHFWAKKFILPFQDSLEENDRHTKRVINQEDEVHGKARSKGHNRILVGNIYLKSTIVVLDKRWKALNLVPFGFD